MYVNIDFEITLTRSQKQKSNLIPNLLHSAVRQTVKLNFHLQTCRMGIIERSPSIYMLKLPMEVFNGYNMTIQLVHIYKQELAYITFCDKLVQCLV